MKSLVLFVILTTSAYAQLPAGATDASSSSVTQPQDPLRAQASAALDQRDFPTALKLLTALAEKNPNDARLLYNLASTQDAVDQNSQAAETYRRAISADPKFFDPHLALALLLARQSHLPEARFELTIAVTLDTPDPGLKARAYRALARLDQSTNPAASSADLLAALKLTPETPDDVLLAAELAEASGDLATAETSYRRLLNATPNGPVATAALAHILLRQNKTSDAEALLLTALTQHSDDTTLNAQLATAYMADSDPAKVAQATPIVERLHASHPGNSELTHLLASLYSRTGEYAKADPLLSQLISGSPQPDPTLLDDRADVLIHLKRSAEAEVLLKRALANPSGFPTKEDLGAAATHLAYAASVNNEPQVTLQALALRATLLPQSPSALFLAATAHDKLHQVKEASDLYKQFLTVADGKFPDEEWEARHRLITLEHQK